MMKQPELGQKLLELRQYKGVTQQEIAEKCNVSIRTIQRIELGNVEPRPMTMKLILEYLGEDFETFMEAEQERKSVSGPSSGFYLLASTAGVIYFILGFPEVYIDLEWVSGHPDKLLFTGIKLLVAGSYIVFMAGFAILGKRLHLKALEFTAYSLMVATTVLYAAAIILVILEMDPVVLAVGESITMGVLSLFFGFALYQLRPFLGDSVLGAAVLEILSGISFIFVFSFFIGLFLMIPAILVEIYLLYSASEKSEAEPLLAR